MPKSIIIVGGSLAGLMQGLQLKRLGNNVTILEQDPNSERFSNQAGIAFGDNVDEFLNLFDATGLAASLSCHHVHVAYHHRPNLLTVKSRRKLSSWGLLYRILRANFDGFPSPACPNPPPPAREDGRAEYRAGRRVTDLQYSDGAVTVHFEDVSNHELEFLRADLVIGADGIHSTVRKLVHGRGTEQYAGYVSWRGTVPEKLVSKATLRYFTDRVCSNLMRRMYAICYTIPTDDGNLEPGERLLNWVVYYNAGQGSPELTDILTDLSGREHHNTVPQGLVRPEVWERARSVMIPQMAAPFAELLSKTAEPFVTKVNDSLCPTATFYDDHVILVGDALATLRPHIAHATEQAAYHCLSLAKVWTNEKTCQAWDREACLYARRMWLVSILVGNFGQGSTIAFLKSLFSYLVFMVRFKLDQR
ncbi:FAD binding domain protein [Annulohypoxylon bovei var. microspora]|nr:FAD binding domain protein [Annulohypoxylon bovei var. microspora]